jgi:hypothetical protein
MTDEYEAAVQRCADLKRALAEAVAERKRLSRAAMVERWRQERRPNGRLVGEASPAARLTEAAVVAIRRRRAAGETLAALAAEYGVTPYTIDKVAKREAWRHVKEAAE